MKKIDYEEELNKLIKWIEGELHNKDYDINYRDALSDVLLEIMGRFQK